MGRGRPRVQGEELARAHQDVIAQMREAMLEARGGAKVGRGCLC